MQQTMTRTATGWRWTNWLVIAISLALIVLLLGPAIQRLSFNVWLGAVATGLCFGFVAIGIYLSFRVLDFPDLTIDGTLPLGAAIASTLITASVDPYVSLLVAFAGGGIAGALTALIATRLNIHSLLASILVTTGLYSINLRIMGRSNIPLLNTASVFTPFEETWHAGMAALGGDTLARMSGNILAILVFGVLLTLCKLVLDWFMRTELGLAMRATGDNAQMIRALGANTDHMIVLGLALSNGLVSLSGALLAQYQGFADINMGIGLIISGLAAVILGETIFRPTHYATATLAVIVGMVLYRIAIAAALTISIPLPNGSSFSIDAQDVKLATAVLVFVALWFTHIQTSRR